MIFMSISAALYAFMLAIIRGLAADLHFTEVVFFRVGFGLVAILPVFARGGLTGMRTTHTWRYLYRAAMQAIAMGFYYLGIALMPLAAGVTLSQTTAIFLAIIAIRFLGEPSYLSRWCAVLLGLIGAIVIIRPSFDGVDWGALSVITSSVIYAIYQVDAKILSRTEPVTKIVAWTMVLATPMALSVAIFFWTWPSPWQLFWLFVMGAAGAFANGAMTIGYKIGEMTALAPVAYTQMIWAAFIGYAAFGELPDIWVWIGAAMIATAGILLSQLEARRAKAGRLASARP